MPPPKPTTHPRHVPALDGLRGIAILMVLAYHYLPNAESYFPGWAGVDLFFVLSGYLITQRLFATRGKPHYFINFYRNRALRILPAYYVLVVGFLLAVHLFVKARNLPTLAIYTDHWKSFLIFTQNWTFIRFGTPTDLSLVPLWSVAVEEQFYLLWPFIILVTPGPKFRLKLSLALLLLIVLARSAFYMMQPTTENAVAVYFNSFFRMDAFLLGSLLCQFHEARPTIPERIVKRVSVFLLALLIAGTLGTKNATSFNAFFTTIGYTILALFFACILHLATQPGKNSLAAALSGKFLRYCGGISYCLYLIHYPILFAVYPRIRALGRDWWPLHPILYHGTLICTALLLSFFISTLSYRYFESRFLRLKK